MTDLLVRELALAWEDLSSRHVGDRQRARELEALYDEARMADRSCLIAGSAISKPAMARLFGEAGPLSALLQLASAAAHGRSEPARSVRAAIMSADQDRRTGRPLFRAIINQMALPLVKRDRSTAPIITTRPAYRKCRARRR